MMSNNTLEHLLAEYNENNSLNSTLIDYISQENIFQLMGKERSENVHSRFLSELFAGCYFSNTTSESTAMHLLDVILKRSEQQGISGDISKLKYAILTRKLKIRDIDVKTEYTLSSYIEDNSLDSASRNKPSESEMADFDQDPVSFYIKRQFAEYKVNCNFPKLIDNVKKSKLDIYIKMQVEMDSNRTVEIFVENKVGCNQNDFKLDKDTVIKQTDKYYCTCSKCKNAGAGNRSLQLFVYLSPVSKRELDSTKDESVNANFVQINYQDILNMVIEPLLENENLSERKKIRLEEYRNCLELPSLPDSDDVAENNIKQMSIMATSRYEQQLIEEYLQNPINSSLIDAAIGNELMNQGCELYAYRDSRMMSFNAVIEKAISDMISVTTELDILKQMDVIERRGGNKDEYNPFLIYCPRSVEDGFIPYELIVYNAEVYMSLTDALKQALEDCWIAKIPAGDIAIFDGRPKGNTKSIYGDSGIELSSGRFLKTNINVSRIPKINSELQRVYERSLAPQLSEIDAERFHSYLTTCTHGLQKVAESKLGTYSRVGQTNFYYRHDVECLSSKILDKLSEVKKERLSADDKELLHDFYVKNRKFILSVYKILTENCTDAHDYEYRKKCFSKLCQI